MEISHQLATGSLSTRRPAGVQLYHWHAFPALTAFTLRYCKTQHACLARLVFMFQRASQTKGVESNIAVCVYVCVLDTHRIAEEYMPSNSRLHHSQPLWLVGALCLLIGFRAAALYIQTLRSCVSILMSCTAILHAWRTCKLSAAPC